MDQAVAAFGLTLLLAELTGLRRGRRVDAGVHLLLAGIWTAGLAAAFLLPTGWAWSAVGVAAGALAQALIAWRGRREADGVPMLVPPQVPRVLLAGAAVLLFGLAGVMLLAWAS